MFMPTLFFFFFFFFLGLLVLLVYAILEGNNLCSCVGSDRVRSCRDMGIQLYRSIFIRFI
jgi:hypothetical protein